MSAGTGLIALAVIARVAAAARTDADLFTVCITDRTEAETGFKVFVAGGFTGHASTRGDIAA